MDKNFEILVNTIYQSFLGIFSYKTFSSFLKNFDLTETNKKNEIVASAVYLHKSAKRTIKLKIVGIDLTKNILERKLIIETFPVLKKERKKICTNMIEIIFFNDKLHEIYIINSFCSSKQYFYDYSGNIFFYEKSNDELYKNKASYYRIYDYELKGIINNNIDTLTINKKDNTKNKIEIINERNLTEFKVNFIENENIVFSTDIKNKEFSRLKLYLSTYSYQLKTIYSLNNTLNTLEQIYKVNKKESFLKNDLSIIEDNCTGFLLKTKSELELFPVQILNFKKGIDVLEEVLKIENKDYEDYCYLRDNEPEVFKTIDWNKDRNFIVANFYLKKEIRIVYKDGVVKTLLLN